MNKFFLFVIAIFVSNVFASEPQIWTVNSRADVLRGDADGGILTERPAGMLLTTHVRQVHGVLPIRLERAVVWLRGLKVRLFSEVAYQLTQRLDRVDGHALDERGFGRVRGRYEDGLEPFIGERHLQQFLQKAQPHFAREEYAAGVVKLLAEMETVFREVVTQFPRVFGLQRTETRIRPGSGDRLESQPAAAW